jgi:hypothetical protein
MTEVGAHRGAPQDLGDQGAENSVDWISIAVSSGISIVPGFTGDDSRMVLVSIAGDRMCAAHLQPWVALSMPFTGRETTGIDFLLSN